MDLFHMQRYWSDHDDSDAEISNEQFEKQSVSKKDKDICDKVMLEKEDEVSKIQKQPEKKKKKSKNKRKRENQTENIEGFTILGQSFNLGNKKVRRVLPQWLSNPIIIAADYENLTQVTTMTQLNQQLLENLKKNEIQSFFPVQAQVIPRLLISVKDSIFRPSDICVSAPTGSGKTLAYVLPILHSLKNRVVPRVRALVVLPVQDLAVQVYKVFQTFNKGIDLKIKVLTSNRSFQQEQNDLVREGVTGVHSLVDILVATPGRLVDHLIKTPGFSLDHLRYLIIDEADRVMEDVQNDWLNQVEMSVYAKGRERPGVLNVETAMKAENLPLQKLLFSATLSQQPEHLQDLNLFEPILFTTTSRPDSELHKSFGQIETNLDAAFEGQFTTPDGLTEQYVKCRNADKIQVLRYFLQTLQVKKSLVFTNAAYRAHNLKVHLCQYGISSEEFSSKVNKKRSKILRKFEEGKLDVLVCSDVVARGIDFGQVDLVVSFDCPSDIKTYIHRVGRTARAGKLGTAVTMLEKESKEERLFNSWMKQADKKGCVNEVFIEPKDLDMEEYEQVRAKAAKILEAEKEEEKMKSRPYFKKHRRQ